MKRITIIHCPDCHQAQTAIIPANTGIVIYHCSSCGATLRPKPGDCCVFCSYADDPCPSMQHNGKLRVLMQAGVRANHGRALAGESILMGTRNCASMTILRYGRGAALADVQKKLS